jgi:hypothetical protein
MADEQTLDLATAEVRAIEEGTRRFEDFYGGVQRFIRRVLIPIVITVWAVFTAWTLWQPTVTLVKTWFVAGRDKPPIPPTTTATATTEEVVSEPQELRYEMLFMKNPEYNGVNSSVRRYCMPAVIVQKSADYVQIRAKFVDYGKGQSMALTWDKAVGETGVWSQSTGVAGEWHVGWLPNGVGVGGTRESGQSGWPTTFTLSPTLGEPCK